MRIALCGAAALLASATSGAWAQAQPSADPAAEAADVKRASTKVTRYKGAMVFDGTRFVARDLCVSRAVLVECPDRPDETVSLAGHFITPPFGDAHTHHFDGKYTLGWHRSIAIESGAFYAMTMTAPSKSTLAIRDQFSGPGNIDVATSLGGVTGAQSHPAEIYEALALGYRTYEEQVANQDRIHASKAAADDAYFIVQTPHDVETKLDMLLANNPDHIKVYLRHSERFDEDWGKWGPGGGINPRLLPLVVKRAREAGKRVAVATSTVFDVRESLAVGADVITHLPCYQDTESDKDSLYFDIAEEAECILSEEDAARAAEIGMASTLVVSEWARERPEKYKVWEKRNIKTLQAAGAPLLLSVDAYGSSHTEGLIAGVAQGYLSAVDALRIGTMATPAFIFPNRKVGCLDPGCSASFIAFGANPLTSFEAIGDIRFRLKDGEELNP